MDHTDAKKPAADKKAVSIQLPIDIHAKLTAAAKDAERELGPFLSRAFKRVKEEIISAIIEAGK